MAYLGCAHAAVYDIVGVQVQESVDQLQRPMPHCFVGDRPVGNDIPEPREITNTFNFSNVA